MDPFDILRDNIELLSPVKRCPKCYRLTLEYDPKQHRIFCTNCGFEKSLPKMK